MLSKRIAKSVREDRWSEKLEIFIPPFYVGARLYFKLLIAYNSKILKYVNKVKGKLRVSRKLRKQETRTVEFLSLWSFFWILHFPDERARFFQETRGYVRDLLACLSEKIPDVDNCHSKMNIVLVDRANAVLNRRNQLYEDHLVTYYRSSTPGFDDSF